MFKSDEVIGHSKKNLVLKTSSNIRVLVGDKYYNLNFRGDDESKESEEDLQENNETIDDVSNDDIIIVSSISEFDGSRAYPGDKKIIFTLDGDIYYTLNNFYNKYTNRSSVQSASSAIVSINQPLKLNGSPALNINDTSLIKNLNAEFLNGKSDVDFIESGSNAEIKLLTVDGIFSSDGKFSYYNGELKLPEQDTNEDQSYHKILDILEIEGGKINYYSNAIYDDICEILGRGDLDTLDNILKFLVPVNIEENYIRWFIENNKETSYDTNFKYVLWRAKEGEWDIDDSWDSSIKEDLTSLKNNSLSGYKVYDGTVYRLKMNTTSNLSIGQTIAMKISTGIYTDPESGEEYVGCDIPDNYLYKEKIKIIKCIISRIYGDYIEVYTDYKSNEYWRYEVVSESVTLTSDSIEKTFTIRILQEDPSYCEFYENIGPQKVLDPNFPYDCVYRDLTGEIISGYNEAISGNGVLLRENTFLVSPKIFNAKILGTGTEKTTIDNSEIINSIISTTNINGGAIDGATLNNCTINDFDLSSLDLSGAIINDGRIVNNMKTIDLSTTTYWHPSMSECNSWSIKGVGKTVSLTNINDAKEGEFLHIYAQDSFSIYSHEGTITTNRNDYLIYRFIPMSEGNYGWILVNKSLKFNTNV